jgi:hypothetical protein
MRRVLRLVRTRGTAAPNTPAPPEPSGTAGRPGGGPGRRAGSVASGRRRWRSARPGWFLQADDDRDAAALVLPPSLRRGVVEVPRPGW